MKEYIFAILGLSILFIGYDIVHMDPGPRLLNVVLGAIVAAIGLSIYDKKNNYKGGCK